MTYQESVIGSTTSSTVPVLRRISYTLTNSYRATEIEKYEVVQHIIR
jgi:hypothetical protein